MGWRTKRREDRRIDPMRTTKAAAAEIPVARASVAFRWAFRLLSVETGAGKGKGTQKRCA